MAYSKEDKQKFYTLECRFFNGETEAPAWMNQNEKMFWFYEQFWVTAMVNGDKSIDYILDHPRMKDFEEDDGTPQDLKALICDRYCHFGGTDEGFMEFYLKEYQVRSTNRQRRTEKRKKELITKCRYYRGEEENPWSYCEGGVLQWRCRFWYWEKYWVEKLSESYSSISHQNDLVKHYGLSEYCKANKQSRSLMNYIFMCHIDGCSNSGMYPVSKEDILFFNENIYLLFAPLGDGSLKYMSFYFGENKMSDLIKEYYEPFQQYAGIEEIFYKNCQLKDFSKDWIDSAIGYINKWKKIGFPNFVNKNITAEQLAIGLYLEAMWSKWVPYDDIAEVLRRYHMGISVPIDEKQLKYELQMRQNGNKQNSDNKQTINYQKEPSPVEIVEREIAEEQAAYKCACDNIKEGTDVYLFGAWNGKTVFRPELCYLQEKEYKFPVVILVDYKYDAEMFCNEESKEIYEKIRNYRIECYMKECFYFKGEKKCPFELTDFRSTLWDMEQNWLYGVLDDYIRENNFLREFIFDFPDGLKFDPRPESLKAFLYSRFHHWGYSKDGFRESMIAQCKEVGKFKEDKI